MDWELYRCQVGGLLKGGKRMESSTTPSPTTTSQNNTLMNHPPPWTNWKCHIRLMMLRGDNIVLLPVYQPEQEQPNYPRTNKSPIQSMYRSNRHKTTTITTTNNGFDTSIGTSGSLSYGMHRINNNNTSSYSARQQQQQRPYNSGKYDISPWNYLRIYCIMLYSTW